MKDIIVVFDMGATHTRVAASTDGQTLSDITTFDTNQNYPEGISRLIHTITSVTYGRPISALVGGIASALNTDRTELIMDSNISDWNKRPLHNDLSRATRANVKLINDVEAVALGESLKGAGRDSAIMGYLTFSTGVNGVRVVDRKIDRHTFGFEIGEHIIGFDSTTTTRFEDATGGKALQQLYGKSPTNLAKDPEIWNTVIKHVAVGVHNALLFWSPEVMVFGGSMMKDIPLTALRDAVKPLLSFLAEPPEFRLAELGDKGGLYGALALGMAANEHTKKT
jgi:predicted NBD/HSP70 family sugar kinase